MWNPYQRRQLYEWEEEEENKMITILQQQQVGRDIEEERRWQKGKEGFSVKVVYNYLEAKLAQAHHMQVRDFPVSKIWDSRIPSKINFFVYKILRGRTLTTDNLRKRNKIMPSRCIMCRREEETAQHLFMDCRCTDTIWRRLTTIIVGSWKPGTPINQWLQNCKKKRTSLTGS